MAFIELDLGLRTPSSGCKKRAPEVPVMYQFEIFDP